MQVGLTRRKDEPNGLCVRPVAMAPLRIRKDEKAVQLRAVEGGR